VVVFALVVLPVVVEVLFPEVAFWASTGIPRAPVANIIVPAAIAMITVSLDSRFLCMMRCVKRLLFIHCYQHDHYPCGGFNLSLLHRYAT
jgi:hypothetical protein